jgi:hypothetical protein
VAVPFVLWQEGVVYAAPGVRYRYAARNLERRLGKRGALGVLAALFLSGAGWWWLTAESERRQDELPEPSAESASAAASVSPVKLEDIVDRALPSVVTILSDEGRGSGFFVDPSTVVTNHHVVGNAPAVLVKVSNGHAVSARVERISDVHDLALVRLDRALSDRQGLALATLEGVRVGQEVVVIGSPMGILESSVTRGIVRRFAAPMELRSCRPMPLWSISRSSMRASTEREFASLLVPNTARPQFCPRSQPQCAMSLVPSGDRSGRKGVTTG